MIVVAAKPETTVQDWVSTLVSVKKLEDHSFSTFVSMISLYIF